MGIRRLLQAFVQLALIPVAYRHAHAIANCRKAQLELNILADSTRPDIVRIAPAFETGVHGVLQKRLW